MIRMMIREGQASPSVAQMPPGIPVATVAIGGAKNAALLAVRILAVSDETLLDKLADYAEEMKEAVMAKDEKLQKDGLDD